MTRDDIIRTMRELIGPESESWSINEEMLEEWLPFLQAIAAAERESCATFLERGVDMAGLAGDPVMQKFTVELLLGCAAAIRARGQQ